MNTFLEELTGGLTNWDGIERFVIRLLAAMFFGAVIGFQRERAGKAAGLRTHMLVAMGSALFLLSCSATNMSQEGLSRVVQGLATGIGFLGAGAILKLPGEGTIKGLTTAADIWMTAAVGVAAGLGQIGLGLVAVAFTWVVLTVVHSLERRIRKSERETD